MNLKNKTYDELCDLKHIINKEMNFRNTEQPIGYACCECAFKVMIDNINHNDNEAFWKVYNHLRKEHGYPDEDAGLGTGRINR